MKMLSIPLIPLAVAQLASLLSSSLFADNEAKLPPLAVRGEGAYVSGELIYALDNKPTPECHASTLVETSDGLVAAWFGGTHEKHPDVGIWVSQQLDGKWSVPVLVADGSEDEEKDFACWNPVLFQPKEGPLMLFYKVGPSPDTWWGVLMTSADNGKTWGNRHRIGADAEALGGKNPNLLGPVKNKPVQLDDGTILCPSSSEHNEWRVHFEASPDNGRTWKVIGPIHDGKDFGAIQPSILHYANGKLQILCRSRQNVIAQSWSEDDGKTWSKMSALHLPNPSAGTDAVTLKDGRQLLVYNHSIRKDGNNGRQILNVATSTDGIEWNPVMTLEQEGNPEGYSYPAVIQAADGTVHITYTFQRVGIKHVVLDPAKL
ncbi:MAG: exo-alpha-sialidase [Verrucomicrobiae bacterium]|nr:exo-alpha-sialidase [Verrucomicrobiae bacterium]